MGQKVARKHASRDHGSEARRIRVRRGNVSDWAPRMGPETGYSDSGRLRCRLRVRLRPRGRERGTEVRRKQQGNNSQHHRGLLRCNRNHHRATCASMLEMTVLVAATTSGNAPAPPHKEQQAQAQTQINMNQAGTSLIRYPPPPPRGVKTTGVDRNIRAIRTCKNCTKDWVTHKT